MAKSRDKSCWLPHNLKYVPVTSLDFWVGSSCSNFETQIIIKVITIEYSFGFIMYFFQGLLWKYNNKYSCWLDFKYSKVTNCNVASTCFEFYDFMTSRRLLLEWILRQVRCHGFEPYPYGHHAGTSWLAQGCHGTSQRSAPQSRHGWWSCRGYIAGFRDILNVSNLKPSPGVILSNLIKA